MLLCNYCKKECKNANSYRNHVRLCKLNPDRVIKPKTEKWYAAQREKKSANQWTKAKETGIPFLMKETTREKLREGNRKRTWSEATRKKLSESMKRVVESNPLAYTGSNRGRTKQFEQDGVKFHGKWELDFYLFCKQKGVMIERSSQWFLYEWNGTRKYFPDFYLPELDLYVEVKGYETERDRAKWKSFPKRLKVIRKEDIMLIRKGQWAFS